MRVLVVRHHEEDSAGFIGEVFEAEGAVVASHLFPDEGPLPLPAGFDAIVVLGSKWSVYDEDAVGAWIGDELAWLQAADNAAVPVLGICFGAQAMTAAFGGRVEPAPAVEVGWTIVEACGPQVVAPGPWFQFHGDRCVLPDHAVLHAANDVGPQAFSIGRHLCVQFHPEVDGAELKRWYDSGLRVDVAAAGVDPDDLLAETIAQEVAARDGRRTW